MLDTARWVRPMTILGLGAMIVGVIDPMEGSIIILGGSALVALSASVGNSRHRALLLWAFALILVGVAAMFELSVLGGVGGTSGRTKWWALILIPYPVGWLLGIAGAIRHLRERRTVLQPR